LARSLADSDEKGRVASQKAPAEQHLPPRNPPDLPTSRRAVGRNRRLVWLAIASCAVALAVGLVFVLGHRPAAVDADKSTGTAADPNTTQAGRPENAASGSPHLAVAPFDARTAAEHQAAWASYLGTPVELENSIGMKLVLIPPGECEMGSTSDEIVWAIGRGKEEDNAEPDEELVLSEAPRHHVKITRPFRLGAHAVTQKEFSSVMGWNPSAKPANTKNSASAAGDAGELPVGMVSWGDGVEFCQQLSSLPDEAAAGRTYRLPTEAEWEYACRAGTTSRWCCGDDEQSLNDYAWHKRNSKETPHPAEKKRANPWGLFGMHGGIGEWCMDWFGQDYYRHARSVDPTGPAEGLARVLRGGDFSNLPAQIRSASRQNAGPATRSDRHGFRVVVILQKKGNEP
jgi:formylglycine-generating enzyme required for sulfatase activity